MVLSILWNPLTKIPDPGKKISTKKITRKARIRVSHRNWTRFCLKSTKPGPVLSDGLAPVSSQIRHLYLDVVSVPLEFHEFGTGSGIPDAKDLLRRPAHDHGPLKAYS